MGRIVFFHERYYIQEVYSGTKKGYILENRNKEFYDGHSHLNNFSAAKYILFLAVREKLPNDLDLYRMNSLYRILEEGPFREKVLGLIQQKTQKQKDMYINIAVKESKYARG